MVYDDESISLLFSRLAANTFTIFGSEFEPVGIGVYMIASMVNHSCIPNCVQSFIDDKLYIKTTKDICIGEEIVISYIDIAQPTRCRRQQLKATYGFSCSCLSCSIDIEQNYWLCKLTANCKGYLQIDGNIKYYNWQMNNLSVTGDGDAEAVLIAIEKLQLPEFPSSQTNFNCSACGSITSGIELARRTNEIYSCVSSGNLFGGYKLSCQYTSEISYIRFQILSKLCVEMIKNSDFEAVIPFSHTLCEVAAFLYPCNHPQVALIFLQHAKLLWFRSGDSVEFRKHYMRAARIIEVTHSRGHPIYRQLEFQ